MRLRIIGSIPGYDRSAPQEVSNSKHQPIIAAAKDLGDAAAEASHRVLIGSMSPWTIDPYVVDGVEVFCRRHPDREAHIEVHRPEGESPSFPTDTTNLHYDHHAHHADPSSPHKWTVAHARTADLADVILAMGGSTNSRLVGHLAADRGKPVIAVPTFGGTAKELYDSVRYRLAGMHVESKDATALLSGWNTGSARSIIKLAEMLLATTRSPSPHNYFLSYCWSDCAIADHIETLLRRQHRPVVRDETDLRAGRSISDGVKALIEECDTFLGIWSPSYAQSSWCPGELDHSINLQRAGKKLKRVLLLDVANHERPLRLGDKLFLAGVDRNARELAVVRLIREES